MARIFLVNNIDHNHLLLLLMLLFVSFGYGSTSSSSSSSVLVLNDKRSDHHYKHFQPHQSRWSLSSVLKNKIKKNNNNIINNRTFVSSLSTTTKTARDQIDIEYFYSVNNDKDGDFIISQLIVELEASKGIIDKNKKFNELFLLAFPIGGIQILTDDIEVDKYYCTAKDSICETSLIHVSGDFCSICFVLLSYINNNNNYFIYLYISK